MITRFWGDIVLNLLKELSDDTLQLVRNINFHQKNMALIRERYIDNGYCSKIFEFQDTM